MSGRTLLVMAGGTGGHVMPGLAVAQVLRSRAWNVVWLGNPQGMESTLVPKYGIAVEPVQIGGLRGKGLMAALALPVRLVRACWQSLAALRRIRPSVVLGMGGYVAFPGGLMAALFGYRLVVHEQNSVAGLTNRVLARMADRVLEAFPGSLPRAVCTGNPVRPDMLGADPPAVRYRERSGRLRLLVLGGSLGARALNEIVPKALSKIDPSRRPQVTHQAGRAHHEALVEHYRELGVEAQVLDFIDDMAAALAGADLVICRAGAMTIAEVAAVGVASVLVPFPHAVDDHQTSNARFLADRGAATLMPQTELNPDRLAGLFACLTRESLADQAERARALARPSAAVDVADICEALADGAVA